MNMKLSALLGGLMALVALKACMLPEVDCSKDPSNRYCIYSGGSGGTGGEAKDGGPNTGGSTGATYCGIPGTGGSGGSAACVGCGTLAACEMGTPCVGSQVLYDEFLACTCDRASADAMPGCKDVCGDNRCMKKPSSVDCDKCLLQGACATAIAACFNDF